MLLFSGSRLAEQCLFLLWKLRCGSEAMFNLGKCYIDGVGTDVRISDGVKWITIAARLGTEEAEKFNLSETFQKESMKRSE